MNKFQTKQADFLEVGEELDGAMAREVMGWRQDGVFWRNDEGVAPYTIAEWKPSTDLNHCQAALQRNHWHMELSGSAITGYHSKIWKSAEAFYSSIGRAPDALCRAMVKAARDDQSFPPITG